MCANLKSIQTSLGVQVCRASWVLQCTEGFAAAGHEMAQQIPVCCWEQRAEPWRNGKGPSFGDLLPAKQSHGRKETSIYPSQQTSRRSLPALCWRMLPKGCTQPPICPSCAVCHHAMTATSMSPSAKTTEQERALLFLPPLLTQLGGLGPG